MPKLAAVAVIALIGFAVACGGGGSSSVNNPPVAAPAVSLSPASLIFSGQTIGTASAAKSVTLTNTGNAALAITSILASGDFSQTNNCGASLGAGNSCAIQVIFTPSATGSRTGTLSIQDNATGSPHTAGLTGTGNTPTGGTMTYYVAPDGNDAFTGTLASRNSDNTDGPYKTFDRARSAVQSLNKTNLSSITVQFRGGTYFLTSPVRFSNADSGTAVTPIVYQNYGNEVPVFSGGVQITGWTNTGGNVWVANLDPVKYQYFEQMFVNGVRRFRPRANGGDYLRFAGAVYVNAPETGCTLQVGTQYRCYDRFQYTPGDIDPNWANLKSPYPAGDVEVAVFEKWTQSAMRIKSVDDVNHIVHLTGATPIDVSATPQYHGIIEGHRYIVENVKDELTQPGQWFLDRSISPWKLTYLAAAGEDVSTAQIVVPQLPQVLTASGLNYVTFKGLTFEHDNWTVQAAGHPSQQGEHDVSAAVSFTNCSHITFDSNTVAHTGGWGVEFVADGTATSTGNQIVNGMAYDIGTGGIRVGNWGKPNDTDANVPQFNTVSNNVVAGVGRLLIAGPGIWVGNSHDNTITHNDVFDTYTTGIEICLPSQANCRGQANSNGPFNTTVSFNHVHDVGQGVSDDMGCIYLANTVTGNQVLNNVCHDIMHAVNDPDGYGGNGIYIDNVNSGVTVKNNLVYRVSQAGFHSSAGPQSFNDPPNVVQNNIFAFSMQGTLTHSQLTDAPSLLFHFTNNVVLFDKGAIQRRGSWYCWNMPCLQIFDFSSNLYWNTNGTLASAPNAFFTNSQNGQTIQNYSFAQWQAIGEDAGSVIADPGFTNPSYPADDFSLVNTTTVSRVGFVPFDWKAAGRTSTALNPPAIPAGFPVTVLNPGTDY